ncbi:unnamed protein product [Malus baccata var. baccata]
MEIERKNKRKKSMKEGGKDEKQRGVCYLGRIPPRMDPSTLRQMLSQHGEIQRLYLAPQDSSGHVQIKAGKFQRQNFSEGWVEFSDKRVAKRVANMLNGEQIGGKKRSSFYYDLWNIKYLSKFKWDNLTEEIAYKKATREQKLALEISAAKKERDFYLTKVEKSRALSAIDERLMKRQRIEEDSGGNPDLPSSQPEHQVIRRFRQKKPVANNAAKTKPRLSKDVLSSVFGDS